MLTNVIVFIIKQQFNDHSSKYHFISLFSPINKIAIHSKDTPHRNKINNEELRSNKNLIKQIHIYQIQKRCYFHY